MQKVAELRNFTKIELCGAKIAGLQDIFISGPVRLGQKCGANPREVAQAASSIAVRNLVRGIRPGFDCKKSWKSLQWELRYQKSRS
jgi:hypothetical protein